MPFLIAHTFVLLLMATAIGLVAGWLVWGGNVRVDHASPIDDAPATAELAALKNEVDARTGDVARLRRKLKRAVEELESHATQLDEAEARIATLSSSTATGSPLVIEDPELMAEVASLREQLAFDRAALTEATAAHTEAAAAHTEAAAALEQLRLEHAGVLDALRMAEVREATLDDELTSARTQLGGLEEGLAAREQHAGLEHDLHEANTLIRDAAERVTYLERQALLWQNEADRLRATIDENAAAEAERLGANEREMQSMLREHETALASLRMEASSSRLRADAAADHLGRLQREFRAVQERSLAHIELNRAAMDDLDRQLAAAHATLNDSNPQTLMDPAPSKPDPTGLLALPGMTERLVQHLNELGVGSLVDVSRWSPDDVARIAEWLPENPDVITANDWVASARALLSSGSVVSTASGL